MSKLTAMLALAALSTLALGCGDEATPPAADGGVRDLGAVDLGSTDMAALTDLGDGGALVDGGESSPWEQYCTVDGPARSTRCGDEPEAVADCRANAACVMALVRPDVAVTIPACLAARACGEGDDACYSATGAGVTPTAAATTFQTDCLAKHSGCPDGMRFPDDACFVDIATDPMIAEITTCLASACGEVSDCFTAVFEARAPGCS